MNAFHVFWKRHRNKAGFVIIMAIMLTFLWPFQAGIELDSTNIPMAQKQLKEALIFATKAAAQQLDQTELHQGIYEINSGSATKAFDLIMQQNLLVNPTTWEPETDSDLPSPLHVQLYLYNQWQPATLPGANGIQLDVGQGATTDPLFPALKPVTISVTRPTILAVASETYTTFWGHHVNIEQYAAAQVDYAVSGTPSTPQPQIASVTFTGTPSAPTITISGVGFGSFSAPYTGDTNALTLTDATTGWQEGCDPACTVTNDIVSWSDTQIVVKPSGAYDSNSTWVFEPGNSVSVSVANPQTENTTEAAVTVSY